MISKEDGMFELSKYNSAYNYDSECPKL